MCQSDKASTAKHHTNDSRHEGARGLSLCLLCCRVLGANMYSQWFNSGSTASVLMAGETLGQEFCDGILKTVALLT